MKKIPFLILVFFLAGCTTGPTLYPNAHLQSVGEAQAQKDIADCEVLADQYVKSDAGIAVAKSTAIGGAGGAVVGGAVGAVTGSLGRGGWASALRPVPRRVWCTASSRLRIQARFSKTS
ncbi:MAG: hypothetical protein MUF67_09875 [Desulfobacterales bacterium]|nr:hypothetical protein [Desulfobacterales bacterium]